MIYFIVLVAMLACYEMCGITNRAIWFPVYAGFHRFFELLFSQPRPTNALFSIIFSVSTSMCEVAIANKLKILLYKTCSDMSFVPFKQIAWYLHCFEHQARPCILGIASPIPNGLNKISQLIGSISVTSRGIQICEKHPLPQVSPGQGPELYLDIFF